jgi:hypothetical protein
MKPLVGPPVFLYRGPDVLLKGVTPDLDEILGKLSLILPTV